MTRRRDKEGADDKAAIRIEANVQPAYAEASAWQALTCLAVAKAKEERSTLNAEVRTAAISEERWPRMVNIPS